MIGMIKIKWLYVRHPFFFISELNRRWKCVTAIEDNCDAQDALQDVYIKQSGKQKHEMNCAVHGPYVYCPMPCDCKGERK